MTVKSDVKPEIPRIDAKNDISLVWPTVQEYGAAIIENFLPPDVVQRLNQDLDPFIQTTPTPAAEGKDFPNRLLSLKTKFVTCLAGCSKTFREDVLNNGHLHQICQDIFNEAYGDYWILASAAMELAPNNAAQALHRDLRASHPLFDYLRPDAPTAAVNFLIAMSPFTVENGATHVVLGSHNWKEVGAPSQDETVQAVMQPGDALLITERTVHGGGQDITGVETRRFVSLTMSASQITPFESHLAIPRQIIESLTPLAQKTLGWRSQRSSAPNDLGLMTVQGLSLERKLGLKSDQTLVKDGMNSH
ncbi:verruculogen synthase [Aspergillus lentulus]|nr:verruculogen synthase [Aspergillus lentulus]